MTLALHLLIHDIAFGISGVIAIGLALFSFINNPRRSANVALALTMVASAIFSFSHIFGVTIADPYASRSIFMFNVSIMFITMFSLHTVLAVLKLERKRLAILVIVYLVGISLTIFYVLNPDLFLAPSVPKMYLPNYYVPGTYHFVMRIIFNIIVPIYFIVELVRAYKKTTDQIEHNRLKYFFFVVIVGYTLGSIPILLVYNIPVDPAWGSLFIFFLAVPFVYATVQYELLDIRIVAKQAFYYGVAIGVVGVLVVLFNYTNQWLSTSYPSFPFWISPLLSSLVIVFLSVVVWKKMRQGDILKSEFIHIVMHKFRTPLTHIKWASETLRKSNLPEGDYSQIKMVESANDKLVELTNLLVSMTDSENAYNYRMEKANFTSVATSIIDSVLEQDLIKNVKYTKQIEPDMLAIVDVSRIKFVIQVLLENAIHYTPPTGTIHVSSYMKDDKIWFSVQDSGIGMTNEELSLLFSKFYRGDNAKLADTEGMGIGLFVSKKIILRHHGKIWAESLGPGKGSTFYFTLPVAHV